MSFFLFAQLNCNSSNKEIQYSLESRPISTGKRSACIIVIISPQSRASVSVVHGCAAEINLLSSCSISVPPLVIKTLPNSTIGNVKN